MKDSFILYSSYEDKFNMLTEKDRGKLITALFAYVRGEDLSKELSPITQMAYAFITQQIAMDTAKYKEICEKRKANGLLGGRPKKDNKPNGFNEKPKQANGLEENQMVFEKTKQNHNEYENDNENDNEYDNEYDNEFVPPTLEEVKSFCEGRNNKIDAERFISFYKSKGWKVGNQPMTDWKSAVITWETRSSEKLMNTTLEDIDKKRLNDLFSNIEYVEV